MRKELKTLTKSLLAMGAVLTLSACSNSNNSNGSKDLKKNTIMDDNFRNPNFRSKQDG